MADEEQINVRVNEQQIGNAAGKAAGNAVSRQLDSKFEELKTQLQQTTNEIENVRREVDELQRRIGEIEQTKARAQRQAIEGLKDDLEDQLDEKRREYQRRIREVLDDYRGSIERLKDRFLNSISGRRDQFEDLEDEFGELQASRETCVERVRQRGDAAQSNYETRLDAVVESRNEFFENIDAFVTDREQTAETIDSLRTSVPGVSTTEVVSVPFWVVGVDRNGHEEIRVHPILERGEPGETPDRASPYVEYLRSHPDHGYDEMTDAVQDYVSRDEIRDSLARRDDGTFADPSFLGRTDAVMDRFIEALRTYELDSGHSSESIRQRAGTTTTRGAAADD